MLRPLLAGLAGATTLTLLHQSARRLSPDAPRLDLLGMHALADTIRAAGGDPPDEATLYRTTLAADLLSNTLYYAFVGTGAGAWRRGALLGLAAGVGAVVLPPWAGLPSAPTNRTRATQLATVAWYTVGGLAAAAASRLLTDDDEAEA